MMIYPEIDPIAIQLGPISVHWYGLMYVIGFLGAWWLGRLRAGKPGSPIRPDAVDDLIFYSALGVVLGGRMGYVLFYSWGELDSFLQIFAIWDGGMSFHGGMLGVFAALWLFARKHDTKFFDLTDFVAPLVPIGLGTGRLGNFINGELWGAPTKLSWGTVYPPLGPEPRHPSMLYEMLLEGVVLFAVLWWFSAQPRPRMSVSGLFLLGYGGFRFLVEFVRLPDAHIGYLAFGWLTMGHLLTLPMILGGLWLLRSAYARAPSPPRTHGDHA